MSMLLLQLHAIFYQLSIFRVNFHFVSHGCYSSKRLPSAGPEDMTLPKFKPHVLPTPRTTRVSRTVRLAVIVLIAAGVTAALWPLEDAGRRTELVAQVASVKAEIQPWLERPWTEALNLGQTRWGAGLLGFIAGVTLGCLVGLRLARKRGRPQQLYGGDYGQLSVEQLRGRLRAAVWSAKARRRLLERALARGLDERGAHEWVLDHIRQERRGWR